MSDTTDMEEVEWERVVHKEDRAQEAESELASAFCSDHLMDYVLKLHIITGPNGMCMCGVDGITCEERLRRVSHEIASAQLGANMAKEWGGVKVGQND